MPTVKGNTLYLHVSKWVGQEMTVVMVKTAVRSAEVPASDRGLEVEQREDRLCIRGPARRAFADPWDTAIRLELEGKPEAYPSWL